MNHNMLERMEGDDLVNYITRNKVALACVDKRTYASVKSCDNSPREKEKTRARMNTMSSINFESL